jgi:hypothetical protein
VILITAKPWLASDNRPAPFLAPLPGETTMTINSGNGRAPKVEKLRLSKETLRELTASEANDFRGGILPTPCPKPSKFPYLCTYEGSCWVTGRCKP